jgi:hypothetical protein
MYALLFLNVSHAAISLFNKANLTFHDSKVYKHSNSGAVLAVMYRQHKVNTKMLLIKMVIFYQSGIVMEITLMI